MNDKNNLMKDNMKTESENNEKLNRQALDDEMLDNVAGGIQWEKYIGEQYINNNKTSSNK